MDSGARETQAAAASRLPVHGPTGNRREQRV